MNMRGFSDKNHGQAQQVWNRITPEIENLITGTYRDVFPAADVLLLPDVFETLQNTYLKHCNLNPAHCTQHIS